MILYAINHGLFTFMSFLELKTIHLIEALGDLRGRVSLLEQLLRSNGIPIPEDKAPAIQLPGAASAAPVDEAEKTELEDQLQESNDFERRFLRRNGFLKVFLQAFRRVSELEK